jgi:LPS-assembly protein
MFQLKCLFCCIPLILICFSYAAAQQRENVEKKVENPIGVAEEQNKALRQTKTQQISIVAQTSPGTSERVLIDAEKQEVQDHVYIATGNVQISYGDMLIIADRATYNEITYDLVAEGNIFFEQEGQRISGERIELNARTKRGTIFTSSAFTNRTPDGTVLVIDSNRADKTGEDTYNLENVRMTACQERVPKWSFTAKRARLRLDHQAKAYNAFFRIKNIPILYLPYASISVSKKDRSSGFLLPSSGSSTIKGRTFHLAYFQTLGRSADILFRTDVFTKRGIGTGFDFRARTNENSRIAFGSFIVFDRLFGGPGPDQGGSSFYADAVQYFKNGFVAVADVNITSNPDFRQVFAENVQTAISPEERSIFYVNKNWRSFSFNGLFGEQSVFIGTQFGNAPALEIVKNRQFPSLEFSKRSTKVSASIPFYFSYEAALEGVRRSETIGDQFILKTPSIVQRLDFFPRLTFPFRSFAGFTLTPSIGIRSTFYSDTLDPVLQQASGQNLFRKYAEVNLDFRPPALAKIYRHRDGTPWFKHVIEPFIEYRRLAGIDEFDRTLRIDERDVVAETNEITYGVSNSFLVRRTDKDKSTQQPHELLNVTLTQKYFFDPTFGGALREGERNQFFPINTLSGFAFGGIKRNVSPLSFRARLRPTQSLFADVRFNYDTIYNDIRDVIIGAGIQRGIFSITQSWYYTRRIAVDQGINDPTTLPGNQLDIYAFVGNPARGPYGGIGLSSDLRDRQFNDFPRDRRLINLTATAGWAWDCCSLNVQSITFNAGLRNESRILFAFTLKGIGTFGTENIGQRRRR